MVTDSAVVETLKEVNRIRNEEVTADEIANAKAKYTGDFVLALERPRTLAQYALDIKINDLPEDFYSTYLEKEIGRDYSQLSTIFSSVESLTIERYIILQRLERVKELLVYDELTLSEIAHQTGYSSVHHLSNQFKKNIGMSPTQFKKLHNPHRKPLDEI